MDLTQIIKYLVPNAEFVLRANSYEGLEWLDERPKPTLEQIEAVSDEEVELAQWRKSTTLSRRKFILGYKRYVFNGKTVKQAIEDKFEEMAETHSDMIEIFQDSLDASTHFDRIHQDVITMATLIGMSETDLDAFYVWCENEEWNNG